MTRVPVYTRRACRPVSHEFPIHVAIADFLLAALPPEVIWSHFPAGEKRTKLAGAKLKRMGLQPGWPDLIFILPGGEAAFIEVKGPAGRLSPEQTRFRSAAIATGARWASCRSVEEAEETLVGWLKPFGLKLRARITARAA